MNHLDWTYISPALYKFVLRHDKKCHLCERKVFATFGEFKIAYSDKSDKQLKKLWERIRPTRDHILPASHGGKDSLLNMKLAHATCNRKRVNRPLVFYQMEMMLIKMRYRRN